MATSVIAGSQIYVSKEPSERQECGRWFSEAGSSGGGGKRNYTSQLTVGCSMRDSAVEGGREQQPLPDCSPGPALPCGEQLYTTSAFPRGGRNMGCCGRPLAFN